VRVKRLLPFSFNDLQGSQSLVHFLSLFILMKGLFFFSAKIKLNQLLSVPLGCPEQVLENLTFSPTASQPPSFSFLQLYRGTFLF